MYIKEKDRYICINGQRGGGEKNYLAILYNFILLFLYILKITKEEENNK